MKAFEHISPVSLENAVSFLTDDREEAVVIAGGTDLVTEMKDRIAAPDRVVNLKSIPGLDALRFDPKEGLRVGALVTLSRLDEDAVVREKYRALAEGAAAAASPQIRHQGTIGGNVCQRPRCPYYRDPALYCYKRGGGVCYSEKGENRYHAIFGGGPSYFVHPSDTAPALVALEATAVVIGSKGRREIPFEEFFVLPEDDLSRECVLEPNEILAEIRIPSPAPDTRSAYVKASQRGCWDFALVSAACVVEMEGDYCKRARIVLGGVAPKPWRVPAAERLLVGSELDEKTARAAARKALEGAKPLSGNAYKVPLGEAIVHRSILQTLP